MARPESQQIAGFYPTPSHLLPHIASLLHWPEPSGVTFLLDPCAGDGEAIVTLRDLWRVQAGIPAEGTWSCYHRNLPHILAAELEPGRAADLRERLLPIDADFPGDAFLLSPFPASSAQATVLFLNPPYDFDREFGRMEHRFLAHFTRFLHAGAGALLFLVPGAGLAASAEFLARHYLDLRACRFPDPDFAAFGQLVVVGRRARIAAPAPRIEEQLLAWAADPESLPILNPSCPDPLVLDLAEDFLLRMQVEALDVQAAQAAFEPWRCAPVGQEGAVLDLFGARLDSAFPPKPAHIALALSVGLFNGHRLVPNDPARHPPILAKGVFDRELLTIGERRDREGDLTATVKLETPRLEITVLDLEQGAFHSLAHGVVPTGADDLAEWNAADLLTHYDRSLTALLSDQIRPLHDPRDAARRIELPRLGRQPFAIQRDAIEAAIKLIGSGRHPFLLAEVGTGKTTMALSIAAALSPEHRERTRAELRRAGYADRLPCVRRLLVVCPPHLLSTWREEAAAVLPGARVQELSELADFDRDAEVYLMSREAAKLGHPWRGSRGRCPRCGAAVAEPPEERATRRLRCGATLRRPGNGAARLATHLAAILATHQPDHPVVARLAPPRLLEHFDERRTEELSQALAAALLERAVESFLLHLDDGHATPGGRLAHLIGLHLADLATVADLRESLTERLERQAEQESRGLAARRLDDALVRLRQDGWPPSLLRHQIVRFLESLEALAAWDDDRPCGEPLFQAEPSPRRVPLARYLRRHHARDFDLLVLDEAHEFSQATSAQSKAALRLTTLPGVPTIVLSGSLMTGYASSLFPLFWALSEKMRAEFGREDVSAFTARYGFRRLLIAAKETESRRGRVTDREMARTTVLGEAPGILPTFLLQHLLPTAIVVHKSELDGELPPIEELPTLLVPETEEDEELLDAYREMAADLVGRIKRERGKGGSGRFLGALSELPSYLDRATDDLPPFVLSDPDDEDRAIAEPPMFPASWRTPKERWLLDTVAGHLAAGRRVLVFVRHTGTGELPKRLLRILGTVAPRAAFLDVKKVPAGGRKEWIDRQILAKDVPVLLVHPNAVRTGLNNLVAFTVAIWYELDASATTYRQANGRLHRIGQTKPVTVHLPCYARTAQETLLDLVARKVTASLQVDGLDLQAALEAAGAGEARTAALASAMGMGQAIWEALVGR